jgi:hypothetical protein
MAGLVPAIQVFGASSAFWRAERVESSVLQALAVAEADPYGVFGAAPRGWRDKPGHDRGVRGAAEKGRPRSGAIRATLSSGRVLSAASRQNRFAQLPKKVVHNIK